MSGKYRDLVDVQRNVAPVGTPTPDYSESVYSKVPCEIESIGGNESYRGRQLEAHVDYVVKMHNLDGIQPDMRLKVTGGTFKGSELNIGNVRPANYRGKSLELELFCRNVPATGS